MRKKLMTDVERAFQIYREANLAVDSGGSRLLGQVIAVLLLRGGGSKC
jgi:hypothetical protein